MPRTPPHLVASLVILIAGAAGISTGWVRDQFRKAGQERTPGQEDVTPTAAQPSPAPGLPTGSLPADRFDFLADTSRPYQERISVFRARLQGECSESDLLAIHAMLQSGAPANELPEHWYVIANDLMLALLAREHDAARFSDRFLTLAADARQPAVIRDYAVQFLAAWLDPRGCGGLAASSLPRPDAVQSETVVRALVAAAIDPGLASGTVPGTALLVLSSIGRDDPSLAESPALSALIPWLLAVMKQDSGQSASLRGSALQASAVLAPQQARPILRDHAFAEDRSPSIRLPAIAALGACGEIADIDSLLRIPEQSPVLAHAARDAASAIHARHTLDNLPDSPP